MKWFKSFLYKLLNFQKIPLPDIFWSLNKEKKIPNANDCSNLCGRYCKALREAGYKADVVVCRKDGVNHALVKCDGIYYDVSFGTRSSKVEDYLFTIPYENLDKWGNEFR